MADFKNKIKTFFNTKIVKNTHKRVDIESEYVLETKDLGITFGGLKAAQNVNLKIKKNERIIDILLYIPPDFMKIKALLTINLR